MSQEPKGPDPIKGELSPEEAAAFDRRIANLDRKIGKAQSDRKAEITAQEDRVLRGRGMAYGLRMSSELVAAILVGGGIGYLLDRWLGTTPWLFLLFFVLGFAAGIVNVTRAFQRMQAEIIRETGGNIGHAVQDDDDD